MLALSVIAISSSAPGGMPVSSGDSGAQRNLTPRGAGADYIEGGDALDYSRVGYERRESTGRVTRRACTARRGLAFYSRRYREWRTKMGAATDEDRTASGGQARSGRNCPRYLAHLWQRKARAARLRYERWFERTYEKWRCIHEHEGAWAANTGNGYYGGLQMTRWFQQTYGPEFYSRWGTADHWPVYAQLVAAERAWRESGFRQWGTAWRCGLT